MTIGIIATFRIREDKTEQFKTEFANLSASVKANEPGNMLYQLTRSRDDAQTYKVMELYTDGAALKAHGEAEYFRAAFPRLAPCFDGEPKIELLDAL